MSSPFDNHNKTSIASTVPVNEPLLDGNEKKYLLEALEAGWISSEGPFVKKFEELFSKRVNRNHGISVCNGTAALEIAVAALGLSQGDEVILPTFTIISCAAAVVRAGAKPVLVDMDPITWNMDVAQIQTKITARTKAIMVVHIYGLPADMDPILSLAKKHGIKIIEDAAEMHGQTYRDQPCGSFGDISVFSFYPNKHITTGEGGMLVTNDPILAERCRSLRNLCFQEKRRFVHEELGWNYRFTNLQAALGLAQLESLEHSVIRKRRMGRLYLERLSPLAGLQLPKLNTPYAENIFWVFGIILKDEISFDAQKAMAWLGQRKVGTRPFFWPMHEQPVFKKMGLFEAESYPVAENLARRGFYVPSGMGITESQIEFVCGCVKEMLEKA